MNDAEERFAERLAEDLARVLGLGILVDDIELDVGEDGRGARVTATLIAGSRIETIEAVGTSVLALYEPLVQRAAELRLRDAFWQIVGPT
ncbi:MAG TPA: hypothetical protein VFJ71_02725 [Candidatus Limnocylindrales bacterium]|nr:hypothetical protein [Candidatus Limnocylindrales bacterium]